MKIKDLSISGIGGIANLTLNFNTGINIICGPNGIGKTTILECIAQSFTFHRLSYVRKKADHDRGHWTLNTTENEFYSVKKTNFHPNDDQTLFDPYIGSENSKNIIYIKTLRSIDYIQLTAISSDVRSSNENEHMLLTGMSITNAKNWFINRHLWSAHDDALSTAQIHNLQVAKSIFNKTDPGISFSKVLGGSNDILLKQHDGTEIYFEYLSSGYKAVLFILLGLIKEIEHRFLNENLKVDDFDGVVLIDELDLHLHPQWQSNILSTLTQVFPNAQFITSTHSAHIIQAAEPDQVISLGRNSEGSVYQRTLESSNYGFKGWTVEEILTDVMGLQETRSPLFVELMEQFELALDEENYNLAQKAYNQLNEMLHPENNLKKLLKIQLASLGEWHNDKNQ